MMTTTRFRRVSLAVAVGAIAAVLAGCSASSADEAGAGESDAESIAYFTMGLSNEYLQSATEGAEEVAAEEGVTIDVFSADFDASRQLTQIQDAISSGRYGALVVEPIDGQTVCDTLTGASESMVVSIYNTPICGNLDELYTEGTIGFFGRHQPTGGELFAKYMAEALPDGGQIAYIPGPSGSSIVQKFSDSLVSSLEEYPNLELVTTIPGDWNAATGLAATQDLLQAHPDIDGIMYGDDNSASAAMRWLIDTGNLGEIKVLSEGGASNIVEMVREGQVYANTVVLAVEESAYATRAAIQAMRGDEIDIPGFDPETKIYNIFKDPMFEGGDPVLTQENADGFESNWSAG